MIIWKLITSLSKKSFRKILVTNNGVSSGITSPADPPPVGGARKGPEAIAEGMSRESWRGLRCETTLFVRIWILISWEGGN